MRIHRSAGALFVILALGGSATPAQVPSPTSRTVRLDALGRVWAAIRYGHPFLAYKDIDWDAALVSAIPHVVAAKDSREYGAAVQRMIDALGDPATRVVDAPAPPAPATPSAGEREPLAKTLEDGVLVLRFTNGPDLDDLSRLMAQVQKDVPRVRDAAAVVVDLRSRVAGGDNAIRVAFNVLGPAMVSRVVEAPSVRTWVHSGYRPQTGGSSGGYFSALQTAPGDAVAPAQGVKPKRVAVLVTERSEIPDVALALQRSGDGILVAEGGVSDVAGVPTTTVRLDEHLTVRIRSGEVMYGDRTGVRADVVLPARTAGTPGDAPMDAALAFVRGGPRPPAVVTSDGHGAAPAPSSAAEPVWRADRTYPEMSYPTLEYRLLALYRVWGVLDLFFPYKHLLTRDWDSILTEFIPRIEAAKDAREYALTIAELASRTEDTHVGVTGSAELTRFFGEAPAPAAIRSIDNAYVVTALLDADAARTAGLQVGDVLVKVDGEDIATRAALVGRYLAASNPQAHRDKIARRLLSGPDGSEAKVEVRRAGGATATVVVPRKRAYQAMPVPRAGEAVRILDGNIGYADLTRLTVPQVAAMFETVRSTRALIFDMRGYPNGTAWSIAPRINTKNARDAAMFVRPMVSGGDTLMKTTFLQPIPPTTLWKYTGPTVMLIDERAISQSEHTGLFFEAANGTTFIGTPTAGANGDVTRLSLPGGLVVGFTGHDVRHADGRQLQKVGLTPHVVVAPTIEGIRSGRDEVLERAMQYLEELKGKGKGQ